MPCTGQALDAGVPDAGAGAGPVEPRLPPVEIQRIIRAHFDTMRACYEDGLRRTAKLRGSVRTRFVIGTEGRVSSTKLDCTTMPDDVAVQCVVDAFAPLQFPRPQGGDVTVLYPIQFNPAP
jgi:hypothetical protein